CSPRTLDVVRGLGADIRTVRARFGDRYRIDADALRRQLSPGTSLVMLASPQDPSALAIPDDDITAILDQMARVCPDAYLLLDERFREAAYRGAAPRPSLAAASPRIVTCSSLSKAYAVRGLPSMSSVGPLGSSWHMAAVSGAGNRLRAERKQ